MADNTKKLTESLWPVFVIAVISGIGLMLNMTSLMFFWNKRDKPLGELKIDQHY